MSTLVIDDDPFVLKLLARQLAQMQVEDVLLHHRGRDAIAVLEAGTAGIDLILCDLQMPEMDGIEVVRHLTRLGYTGGLVLISSEDNRILATAEKLATAHRLNVLGALTKPVATERLRDIILAMRAHSGPSGIQATSVLRSYSAGELRDGIAAGQLVNFYQPKIDLRSGAVAGVEALVRWRHPQDGLVMPDHFIGLAERGGLISALTSCVLREALHQARCWQDAAMPLTVSVNVSMEDLATLDFPEFVMAQLAEAGVAASALILEVTETRLMREKLTTLDIVTRLRLRHIGLSIDDFGTGHSTLAQLRDIPFSELKLDRSFVHEAARDPARRAIFDASLGMARQLGLKTVAEGAEDLHDWNFLRGSGCDIVQGYFAARPMPAAELPAWIRDWGDRYRALAAMQAAGP